jgi:hypothetical protein
MSLFWNIYKYLFPDPVDETKVIEDKQPEFTRDTTPSWSQIVQRSPTMRQKRINEAKKNLQ